MAHGRFLMRAASGIALILAVGSCAPTPAPQPASPAPQRPIVAPPQPVLPPVVAPAGDWDELPLIEGGWSYDAARRRARFVDDSGLERASLTCAVPGKTMVLALPGQNQPSLDIRTSAGASSFALRDGSVELAVGDIALDRMAFSRGRFGLRASTLLVLPVQSEIGRVIEDCRG